MTHTHNRMSAMLNKYTCMYFIKNGGLGSTIIFHLGSDLVRVLRFFLVWYLSPVYEDNVIYL